MTQWDRFDAHECTYKDALEVAYDAAYLSGAKDDVLGLGHLTVADVLDHLEAQCLAMTTLEKNKKLAEISIAWDKNDDIDTFFDKVDKLKDDLSDHYTIEWPEELQLLQVVAQMFESGIFTRREIMDWESKDEADKTMKNTQDYFT